LVPLSEIGTKKVEVLAGRRVLLVEDESLVAAFAEEILLEAGCEVILAMSLDKALALAVDQGIDLAVLDVNLGSARSYPIADILRDRAVPFIFATGYGRAGLDEAYRSAPVVQKPYRIHELLSCAEGALKDRHQ
jgi:DNA-binding response OmpR family regulator